MSVHSILPTALTDAVDDVLSSAGIEHVAHGDNDPVRAASAATSDPDAEAVIGPFRSRDVAEAVEATAPVGLPMLVPAATWVGVTRRDEPGCDEYADHRGTVFRLVARDSVVAQRISDRIRDAGDRAIIVAGDHDYGRQLAAQLIRSDVPRASDVSDADVVVLAGLAGHPEIDDARALAPLPVIAFDGIQSEEFPRQHVLIALSHAATEGPIGVPEARRAAEMLVVALQRGGDTLRTLRELGPFDEFGDLLDPMVRFEVYSRG